MVRIGLGSLTLKCRCEVGVFFVLKKNDKIQLILDCRRANVYFRDLPSVVLLTSQGLGRSEEVESAANDLREIRVFLASGDVQDCFHLFRIRGPLRQYSAGH